jgi:hypothetical protein
MHVLGLILSAYILYGYGLSQDLSLCRVHFIRIPITTQNNKNENCFSYLYQPSLAVILDLFLIGQPFKSLEIIQLNTLSLFHKSYEKTTLSRDHFFIACRLGPF